MKCELKTIAPATFVTPFFSISNFFVFKFNRLSSLVHLLRAHRAKMCDVLHLRKTSFCCCLLCIVLRQWPRQVFKFHMVSCSLIVMDMILLLSLRFFFVFDFVRGQSSSRSSTRFAHNFLWKRVCFYAFRCLLEAWEFSCLLIIFSPKNKKKRTTATTTRDK